MNDLISVIVPVYNVEQYLDRCIQSIVDQTYKNLEIILIDDGSTDSSGQICDNWAQKDDRIKVIHQRNMGGGAARNSALDLAKGDYVAFVDSDDYISPDMYAHLYGLLSNEIDISECDFKSVFSDEEIFEPRSNKVELFNSKQALEKHIEDKLFRQIIWNKLYKRSVIDNIRFPLGTKIDDEFFTYRIIGNAQKLIRSERVCYAYRQHWTSVMHVVNCEKSINAIEAKVQRLDYIKNKFPELTNLCLKNLWFTCIYQYQRALMDLKGGDIKRIREYIKTVLIKYPIGNCACSIKEKIWLLMAKVSLPLTCKIRNMLKVGL